MNATDHHGARHGLRAWWASPPRPGMRRLLSPWEYRHPRAWARLRIVSAVVLVGLGITTTAFGGDDAKTFAWTLVFLAAGAAQIAGAAWDLSIARSSPPAS
jgi:hypothetical protein